MEFAQVFEKFASFDATGILEKLKDVLLVGQVMDKLKGYWETSSLLVLSARYR